MTIERVSFNLLGKVKRVTPLAPGYRETLIRKRNSEGGRTEEEKFSTEIEVVDDEHIALVEVFQNYENERKVRIPKAVLTAYEITNYDGKKTLFNGRVMRVLFRYSRPQTVEVER